MTNLLKDSINRRNFLQLAGSAAAVPMISSLPTMAHAEDVVEISVWQWAPKFELQIEAFHKSQNRIRVKQVPVASSTEMALKLRNALAAGSGGPDVAMLETSGLAAMNNVNAYTDITADVQDVKGVFVPGTLEKCMIGDKILGLPLDSAPMLQIYREDVLGEMGVKVPVTWDDFAAAAETVKSKKPESFLTNTFFSDAGWSIAQIWQRGSKGCHLDGETISIDLNGKESKDFADYWQRLIDAKLTGTEPGFTGDFFAALDSGRYLNVVSGCWFPNYARTNAKQSVGKWRVAKMPQVKSTESIETYYGGSLFGVFSGTKHPKEALEVVKYMMAGRTAAELFVREQYLTPVLKELTTDPSIINLEQPFCGNQKVNEVTFAALADVKTIYEFSPFHDFVAQTMNDELAPAANGARKLTEAFDRIQDKVVAFAKDQGFTVKA